jgi:hypothetical protein
MCADHSLARPAKRPSARRNQRFAIAGAALFLTAPAWAQDEAPVVEATQTLCVSDVGLSSAVMGAEGSTAPLWLKPGVNVTCLGDDIRAVLPVVIEIWSALSAPTPVITSGVDGVHMQGSRHGAGQAIDLRLNNVSVALGRQLCRGLGEALNARFPGVYQVVFEYDPATPNVRHCHAEFDRHSLA